MQNNIDDDCTVENCLGEAVLTLMLSTTDTQSMGAITERDGEIYISLRDCSIGLNR